MHKIIVFFSKIFGNDDQEEWGWQKISNGRWIAKNKIKKSKYNIVEVWIKTESREGAKKWGTSYSHRLALYYIDCIEENYTISKIWDVLDQGDLVPLLAKNYGEWKNINQSSNRDLMLTIYGYVCKN